MNVRDLVNAEFAGRVRDSHFVKNGSQVTTAGMWYDLTGSSGNPRSKQWFDAAPLTAAVIRQSTDGGIYHGSDVAPLTKYLRFFRLGAASITPVPMSVIMSDYLLYYPTIEDGTTDPQVMDNTQTLTRYTDGEGVMMMAVTISSRTGGQQFNVTYTNQDGVAGRVTPNVTQNAVTSPGTVTTTALASNTAPQSPYIPLQMGDTGVRSVESVQMLGVDTGFFAIVLLKPIASSVIRSSDANYDKDMLLFANELARIYDDAYLSLVIQPSGSINTVPIRGAIKTVWN